MKRPNHSTAYLLCYIVVIIYMMVPQGASWAQEQKNVILEKQPEITHGPYLTAPSETSVTITWKTDMLAHSRIKYGIGSRLKQQTEPEVDGFLPVDTLHSIHLTNLQAGQSYNYRVISTGVEKLKPYWPIKTRSVKSPVYSFSTLSPQDSLVTFSFITDSQHENIDRLNANLDLVDWNKSDFLVHGGDALSWVKNAKQIFSNFLDPISSRLYHTKPLVYVRGNHEMRGPYARAFKKYVSNPKGDYYYTFNAGPVHFIVLDTGEDKSDAHEEYGGLNDLKSYRQKEFDWFKDHVQHSPELAESSFQIIFMHAPRWGWVDGEKTKWTEVANKAGIDLIIAGHWHRFVHISPGEYNNRFPILVVDQDQAAHVEATGNELKIMVKGKDGSTVDSFSINKNDQH